VIPDIYDDTNIFYATRRTFVVVNTMHIISMYLFSFCTYFDNNSIHSYILFNLFIHSLIDSLIHSLIHLLICSLCIDYFFNYKIYVIDSADRRRMEETGVELQQLLDEVRKYLLLTLIVVAMVTTIRIFRAMFPLSVQNKLSEQCTVMCRIRGEGIVMMVLRGK
jgi:large-conductance mechanosensitive channel